MEIIPRTRLNEQLSSPASEDSQIHARRSIETLVVILAVITIVGVFAGIIARLCGGRHLGGSGEHDIKGWVEIKCSSCLDGGISAQDNKSKPASPPHVAQQQNK